MGSHLFRSALQDFSLFPCLTLLIFLSFFSGVFMWVFRRGVTQHYEDMRHVPLNDTNQE